MAATLILLNSCASDDESGSSGSAAAPVSAPSGGRPMIVDYSPTLSDVPALMFLATHPDVDLLAVTLPGTGEADCVPGVRQTRALLIIAGRPDTPVGCGRDEPMAGDRDWPEAWRGAANQLPGVLLPHVADEQDSVDAEELLAATLRDSDVPVTIVTLAPLTNLGRVFRDDPSLADHVHSIVTMGGALDVAGNVDAAPSAEWNLYIDPESVRAVLDSGVPITFVGLDATNSVPGNAGIYARLERSVSTAAGESVRQLWSSGLDVITSEGWFFWDELAAVVAVDASVATISERTLLIDDDGATVADEDGVAVRVATAADPAEFERVFLEVFAGGVLDVVEFTPAEQEYLDQVAAALAGLDARLGEAFMTLESQVGEVPADEVIGGFAPVIFAAVAAVHDVLIAVVRPAEYQAHHDELLAVAAQMVDGEAAFVDWIDANVSSDPMTEDAFFGMFEQAAEDAGIASLFEEFEQACDELELLALARGATSGICVIG